MPPPVAVNVEEPPAQIVWVPETEADGAEFTVKARFAVAVQPDADVTVTVYVPAALTEIAALVAPVLHK